MSDADEASKEEQVQEEAQAPPNGISIIPGDLPATLAPAIPDWYKVGWRQVGGIDIDPLMPGEQKDRTVLDMFLGDQFYGRWYYNAGIIIFVCSTV